MVKYYDDDLDGSKLLSETTININKEIYDKISEAAKKYGVSRSKLVAMLLARFVQKNRKRQLTHGTVRYQPSQPKENWKALHVTLPAHMHDFFDDVRKLWKMSVSFLVTVAVQKFLTDDFIDAEKEITDNYWWGAHTIVQFENNGLQYILCCWGIPEKPPEIPQKCFTN